MKPTSCATLKAAGARLALVAQTPGATRRQQTGRCLVWHGLHVKDSKSPCHRFPRSDYQAVSNFSVSYPVSRVTYSP